MGVAVAVEVGAVDVGSDVVVEDVGELLEAESAGEVVVDTTDVAVNSSSSRWHLRSMSRGILASSKAATMRLTVVVALVFMAVGGEDGGGG